MPFLLAPLLLACGSTRPPEPQGPDGKALAMETLVQARSTEVVLSARWRAKAKVQAMRVEEETPGIQLARGSAVVTIEGLRIEADEVKLRWLAEGEYRSVEQMKGSMSLRNVADTSALERGNYMKALISYTDKM